MGADSVESVCQSNSNVLYVPYSEWVTIMLAVERGGL
jgi:hypothetical protein